jgi:DNA-binding response OmpR family regulator
MLSYAPSKHHHTPHAGWSPLVSRTKRPRIVVAGSEARLLRLLHHKLGRAGYHVLPAADGDAALDLIYGYDPQLCLLDATLPVRSGWEVLRQVQQVGSRDLKVIMMTARSVEAEIAHVHRFGAVACLTKPIDLAELFSHVHLHLGRR